MLSPIQPAPESESHVTYECRLVSEVLRKDRKATAEFVSMCADWVYPYVRYRILPGRDVVEDLMQEVLLSAWQSLPNFRGESSLRQWILAIARHKVEDFYRKRLRDIEIPPDDSASLEPAVLPIIEEKLDAVTRRQRIDQVLAAMPEPYRVALLWRYRDDRSTREMAQLTGKSEKAIERLLARARENFRKRWSDANS
jgi:RNA polymerase sigma-70 factor (ECF subfamily)